MKNKGQNLLANIALFALNGIGSRLGVFLLVPLYAHYMSKSEFGTADLIYSTVSVLLLVCTLKVPAAVLRFAMNPETDRKEVLDNGLFIVFVSSAATALLTFVFVTVTGMTPYLYFIPVIYFLASLKEVIAQYSKAIGQGKIFAFDGFVSSFVLLAASVIFLMQFRTGIFGYLMAIAVSNLVSIVYLAVFAKIPLHFSFSAYKNRTMREMLAFCCPMVPNSISWRVIAVSDHYMVAGFIGAAANGVYSIAYKIPSMLGVVADIFIQAWLLSAIDEYERERDYSKFARIYACYEALLFLASSFIIGCNRYLCSFFLGPEFSSAYQYTPFLLIALLFSNVQAFFAVLYNAAKQTRSLMSVTMFGAGVNVALNFCLIPWIGVYGAIIATCASYLLIMVLRIRGARKFIVFKVDFRLMAMNSVLLLLQACNDVFNDRYFLLFDILCFAAFCLLNWKRIITLCRDGLEMVKRLLNKHHKDKIITNKES